MSPTSTSKPKERKTARVHVNATVANPAASGYNPLSGTFHAFEAIPVSSTLSSANSNGRFRNIDDTDDHNGNFSGSGIDYDAVSNNGSWSGESEDPKEKASQPKESAAGAADSEKREKMRLKNERKHQRQKERRAQELREKCSGYLMSRKLESLAQQLVAMGFSAERATMALILNEGRVEESVSWLFDNNVEEHSGLDTGGNLKIDISDELAKITDMEIRYKASKQEVERAVVAYEGDIEKAEEMLSKKEHNATATVSGFDSSSKPTSGVIQTESKALPSANVEQLKRDFNYTKVMRRTSPDDNVSRWPGNELKNLQLGSMREPVIIMQRPQSMNLQQQQQQQQERRTVDMTAKKNGPQQQQSVAENGGRRKSKAGGLSAASSLGLFSNGGSSSSAVDWNDAGSSSGVQFDYANIDWSLDVRLLTSWRSGGGGGGAGNGYGGGVVVPVALAGVGSGEGGGAAPGGGGGGGGGSGREQRGSEKDMFNFPRRFVFSPSL